MNLDKLFKMQKALDERINKEKGLEGQDLLPQKILALQVELGELANELPEVFKFWSNKKNNYEKALIEYCDCLHFILSIGNELGFHEDAETFLVKVYKPLVMFGLQYDVINSFSKSEGRSSKQYYFYEMISWFFGLGKSLGFTWEQIEQAYLDKNAINHTRQSEGY